MAKKPTTEQVRIDPTFARKLRTLAEFRGQSAGEYIMERLGPLLERDVADMAKKLTKKPKPPDADDPTPSED